MGKKSWNWRERRKRTRIRNDFAASEMEPVSEMFLETGRNSGCGETWGSNSDAENAVAEYSHKNPNINLLAGWVKNTQHKLNSSDPNHFALQCNEACQTWERRNTKNHKFYVLGARTSWIVSPLMGSCGAILGIIEQSTRSQNAAHFNKNCSVWSHFVSHSLVHTILMVEAQGKHLAIWMVLSNEKVQTERKERRGNPKQESQISPPEKNATLAFHLCLLSCSNIKGRYKTWYRPFIFCRIAIVFTFTKKLHDFGNGQLVNLQALGLIFIFPGQIFIIVGCRHENPVIHYGASLSAATSPACSYIPIHIDQFCINIAPSPLSPDHPQTEWTSLQKLEAYGPSRQTNAKRGEMNIWYTCSSGWLQVVLLFGTLPSYGSNKLYIVKAFRTLWRRWWRRHSVLKIIVHTLYCTYIQYTTHCPPLLLHTGHLHYTIMYTINSMDPTIQSRSATRRAA